MASNPESNPAVYFGFTDLHSFKDFITYVYLCAPDLFPEEEWLAADEQMNTERAFAGLRYGLKISAEEKGELPVFIKCRELIEEAYSLYREGQDYDGQLKLREMSKLIKKIPSQ